MSNHTIPEGGKPNQHADEWECECCHESEEAHDREEAAEMAYWKKQYDAAPRCTLCARRAMREGDVYCGPCRIATENAEPAN